MMMAAARERRLQHTGNLARRSAACISSASAAPA
jgi:hypothetical protein